MTKFLSEMKRRDVAKVGIAYAATAWVVIDIASVVFPIFHAPEWVLQVFTTLIIIGFPVALVFAWVFELTPEGLKRTVDLPADQSKARLTSRRLDFMIIGMLSIAVATIVFDRFSRKAEDRDTQRSVAPDLPVTAETTTNDPGISRNSIAVLPFVNLSMDIDQEYFSDGLTEELLNRLAHIRALRVPARTSSFSFKGKNVDLREVGDTLGVGTVLEGSVRKSGDRVRVTAQLIDVGTGYHLWSESYDRKVTDILTVQDDITVQIMAALNVLLDGGTEALPETHPVEPELYQLALRGRYYWNQRTEEGFTKAIELFREAIQRDPKYAPAYAGLADTYLSEFDYGLVSWEDSTVKARAAVSKALELNDGLAEAHTSLAHILLHEWEWHAAEREFRRALEFNPSYTIAHHWYALCLTALGRTEEAVQTMQRALALDPVSVRISADLGMAYLAAGRNEEAVRQEVRALELAPESVTPKWIRGMALEQMGRFDEAEADMQAALEAWGADASVMGSLGHLYAAAGKEAEARKLLAELVAQSETNDVAFFVALIHAGLNETDEALRWLEQAVDARSGSVRYLTVDPRLKTLRKESRYRALIERVGLAV